MTALKQLLPRHPLGWRLLLTLSALLPALVLMLFILNWPSLTHTGVLRRLARESAVAPGEVLAIQEVPPALRENWYGVPRPDQWLLAWDGVRYQLALVERCADSFLLRPSYYEWRPAFQEVTPADSPLQYRCVLAIKCHLGDYNLREQDGGSNELGREYLVLVFSHPSVVRVEARQTRQETTGGVTAYIDSPIPAQPILPGVWLLHYTDVYAQDLRDEPIILGYDADGNQIPAAPPPNPSFA